MAGAVLRHAGDPTTPFAMTSHHHPSRIHYTRRTKGHGVPRKPEENPTRSPAATNARAHHVRALKLQ